MGALAAGRSQGLGAKSGCCDASKSNFGRTFAGSGSRTNAHRTIQMNPNSRAFRTARVRSRTPNMVLHRPLGDPYSIRDFAIAVASNHESQDLGFTLREWVGGTQAGKIRSCLPQPSYDPLGDHRLDQGAPFFKSHSHSSSAWTNSDDSWTLPMPARFIVDRQGWIRSAAADPDYTTRPEPDDTVKALPELVPPPT